MRSRHLALAALTVLMIACVAHAVPPADASKQQSLDMSANIDNDTYIDANHILMFVTNHGNFGRDLADVFGYDYGTFFPFNGTDAIRNGSNIKSPLFAAGLWLGGKVNGQTRVTVSEYSSDYTPGPMADSTYQADQSSFKVYKLYEDSLEANPNADYLNWPVDQGAPVNIQGKLAMLGNQMLWTVFNDADPLRHVNDAGHSEPLGIEVQQTVWAADEAGTDTLWPITDLGVYYHDSSHIEVRINIVSVSSLTGHDYGVVIDRNAVLGMVWHLVDFSTGETLLANETTFAGNNDLITDGFQVKVTYPGGGFSSFQVVANASGPLDPAEPGALHLDGFPTPLGGDGYSLDPTDRQQVGAGLWAIHTFDNGGSCGGGTRSSYDAFRSRVTRDGLNLAHMAGHDYEMRFTGSNDNPGVGGSLAREIISSDSAFWVPFELWDIGEGTPGDPTDDHRLCIFIIDYGSDNSFNLESWGCITDPLRSGGLGEHSASSKDDDPFTDAVYWYDPLDKSPGEAGYKAVEAKLLAGDLNGAENLTGDEMLARTVLINWNGHTRLFAWDTLTNPPVFNQNLPEVGTIFRVITQKSVPVDTFTFKADRPPVITGGPESQSVYIKYKLLNKGPNRIDSLYTAIWADPDLGGSGDDLVGCDTLNDIFYCYNATNVDDWYGETPPAVGFKVLRGPLVPAADGIADFGRRFCPGIQKPAHDGLQQIRKRHRSA